MASRSKRTTRKLNPGVYARPDGNLQAHMAIPADVRFAFGGKSKIVRSLGTSDPAQANRMHAQLVTKQEGRTVSPPRYPALRAKPKESEDGNRAKNDRGEMPIVDYHEKIYIPANIEKIVPNTLKVKRQSIGLFAELIGNHPVFMITRADVKDFQSDLLFLPDQRTIPANLKDMSLREIVNLQKAGSITLKRPAAGTVNKHVSNVKVVLKAAYDAGHMRINPVVDMMNVTPTASNPRTEKRAFTRIELQQIFALPMFAGCAGDTERGRFQPGPVKIRDERFWIPILLFLTGARADEVAGLEKADIKFQNGQARVVFRFTALRRLKNRDSEAPERRPAISPPHGLRQRHDPRGEHWPDPAP